MLDKRKRPATRRERLEFGRNHRRRVPRVDQRRWKTERACPALDIVLASNAGRLPELVPIRMGRMARSPFAYFRGAAAVMAADLSALPTTGLAAQICGDAHVTNLGAFAAPDGHLVFDLNDFDETIRGPWEWDLKRLGSSLVLAGREAGEPEKACADAVQAMVRTYRTAMRRFSRMPIIDLARYEVRRFLDCDPGRAVLAKAERATRMHVLMKLTVPSGKKTEWRRFAERRPLLTRVTAVMAKRVLSALVPYRETLAAGRRTILDAYTPVDVAFKVVGLGSVGTRDYVVLCYGNGADDPLFLQVKEERPSVYEPYVRSHLRFKDLVHRSLSAALNKHIPGDDAPSRAGRAAGRRSDGHHKGTTPSVIGYLQHQGRRVASGQLRMQTVSDPFLGWTTIQGIEYLVRQLNDHKAAIELEELCGSALTEYAIVCGEVLAKAHARTGDPAAVYGYCGGSSKLDKALAQFSLAYADQTSIYYEQFVQAIRSGKVSARRGI